MLQELSRFAVLAPLLALPPAAVLAWAWILWRVRETGSIVPRESRPIVPWHGVHVASVVLAVLACELAASGAGKKFLADPTSGPALLVLNAAAKTAATLLVAAVLHLGARATLRDLGWDAGALPRDMALGGLCFLALSVPVYALQWALALFFPPSHALTDLWAAEPSLTSALLIFLVAVIVAPVSEEFLFRVVLQGWLERLAAQDQSIAGGSSRDAGEPPPAAPTRASPADSWEPHRSSSRSNDASPDVPPPNRGGSQAERVAPPHPAQWPIVGSAAVFALLHLGAGPSPLPLFVFALGLGYLYQRTGRITGPILAHAALNAYSLLLLWLPAAAGR